MGEHHKKMYENESLEELKNSLDYWLKVMTRNEKQDTLTAFYNYIHAEEFANKIEELIQEKMNK